MSENEREKDPMPLRTISGSARLEGGEKPMISSECQILSNSVTLTRRQARAIPLILGAKSVGEGCAMAGVKRQTWYNWMHHEGFKAAVCAQKEAASSEALGCLKAALTAAVQGLTGLVEAEQASVRLKACTEVIDYFLKVRELEDTERRLAALEKAILGEEREVS